MSARTELARAIENARAFLHFSRDEDGLWRDFRTLAGPSSDWVTGFVAYALMQVDPLDEVAHSALVALARRQRKNGGWAYNKHVPSDCDSTAWALLALSMLPDRNPETIRRGLSFMVSHQDLVGGGFSTYSVSDAIQTYIKAPDLKAVQGWTQPHVCVTAAALQAMFASHKAPDGKRIASAARYLLESRQPSGIWRSYWWNGYAYPTYLGLKALSLAGSLSRQDRCRSAQHLLRLQRGGGWGGAEGASCEARAFQTAFVILALLLCLGTVTSEAARNGLSWLSTHQNADGSWPAMPILRIPPPLVKDPETLTKWKLNRQGTGVIIADDRRVFTTAAVVWALGSHQSIV